MPELSVSILSADMMRIGDILRILKDCDVKIIHIDIMDGHFVPNISIGHFFLKQIRNETNATLDVHLMIENPELQIKNYAPYSDILTVHYESTVHLDSAIKMIHDCGSKAGVAIVPTTHELILDYIYDSIDQITVMTVNPGAGGQKFLDNQLRKISHISEKLTFLGARKRVKLSVDGGVNDTNIHSIIKHGADILVVGNAIFKDGITNISDNIRHTRSFL